MKISFIQMSMNQNLRVNKTNFHIKDFALRLALKQRRNATRKSPIILILVLTACCHHHQETATIFKIIHMHKVSSCV